MNRRNLIALDSRINLNVVNQNQSISHRWQLKAIVWIIVILIGGITRYRARYFMNSDGVSYLDLGQNLELSPLWSPAYSWLLGFGVWILDPNPLGLYPVAHAITFLGFLFSLVALNLLLKQLEFDFLWFSLAHAVFVWVALVLTPPVHITPDLFLLGFVLLAMFFAFRIVQSNASPWFLGISIGLGYLFKTPMLPFGLILIAWVALSGKLSATKAFVAVIPFVLLFVIPISIQTERLTMGDNTRLNYLWHFGGVREGLLRNEIPERIIGREIEIINYGGVSNATYPIWYNPSLWWKKNALDVDLSRTFNKAGSRLNNLVMGSSRVGPFVLLLLPLIGLQLWQRRKVEYILLLPLVLMSALFSVVHLESRYVAPFVMLAFLATPVKSKIGIIFGILFLVFALLFSRNVFSTSLDSTSKGKEYDSIITSLHDRGIVDGDSIATLEWGIRHQGWAKVYGLKIVGNLYNSRDVESFATLEPTKQQSVLSDFNSLGAKAVFSYSCPDYWTKISGTGLCWYDLRRLSAVTDK